MLVTIIGTALGVVLGVFVCIALGLVLEWRLDR